MSDIHPTATVQDYLWVIYVMERDNEPAIAARLAEIISVSPPTVTMTLRRMSRDGLVEVDRRKGIRLTGKGRQEAQSVLRRHMLTEWLLAKNLQVPWAQTHSDAHQIEHALSQKLEERLIASLDDPAVCPHGNPLPGRESEVEKWHPLADQPVGKEVVIRRVHEFAENDQRLLEFLQDHGLLPGAHVLISEVLPFNQSITLIVLPPADQQRQVVLGMSVAKRIFVE